MTSSYARYPIERFDGFLHCQHIRKEVAQWSGIVIRRPFKPLVFILKALHHMFRFAVNHDMLSLLGRWGLAHRPSFFADNVMLFLRLIVGDVIMCFAILEDFEEASSLRINPVKCVALPI